MILPNGSEYKLIFLDTNILQTIVTNPSFTEVLFERFFLHRSKSLFCFSFYNIIELKNKRDTGNKHIDIYNNFVFVFSQLPCLMFLPHKSLLQEELSSAIRNTPLNIDGNVANAFIPGVKRLEFDFERWLDAIFIANSGSLEKSIQEDLADMAKAANAWMKLRSLGPFFGKLLEKLHRLQEATIIQSYLETFGIKIENISFTRFPSARTILFSKNHRVHSTKRILNTNDVIDILQSAYAPYVDTVITETYQAEV